MATKKKVVKVRDLKPSKDAKGGVGRKHDGQRGSWTAVGSSWTAPPGGPQ